MAGHSRSELDQFLQRLREIFEQIDKFIHVPFFEMIVEIPEGNEQALYALADTYRQIGQTLQGYMEDFQKQHGDLSDVKGDGAPEAARQRLLQHQERVTGDFEVCNNMMQFVHEGAINIESTKYMGVMNFCMLAATLIHAIVTSFLTFGAASAEGFAAIALCRQALKTAATQLLKRLSETTLRGMAKAAAVRGAVFTTFTLGMKTTIFAIQSAQGHNPTFNAKAWAIELVDSFLVGALAGPLAREGGIPNEMAAMALGQLGNNLMHFGMNKAFDAADQRDWATRNGLYRDDLANWGDMGTGLGVATFGALAGNFGMGKRAGIVLGDLRLRDGGTNLSGNLRMDRAAPLPTTPTVDAPHTSSETQTTTTRDTTTGHPTTSVDTSPAAPADTSARTNSTVPTAARTEVPANPADAAGTNRTAEPATTTTGPDTTSTTAHDSGDLPDSIRSETDSPTEPTRGEPTTQAEPAPTEPARTDLSLTETAHTELPTTEQPRTETTDGQTARTETAHSEAPNGETARTETTRTDAPNSETSHSETTRTDAPHAETTHSETTRRTSEVGQDPIATAAHPTTATGPSLSHPEGRASHPTAGSPARMEQTRSGQPPSRQTPTETTRPSDANTRDTPSREPAHSQDAPTRDTTPDPDRSADRGPEPAPESHTPVADDAARQETTDTANNGPSRADAEHGAPERSRWQRLARRLTVGGQREIILESATHHYQANIMRAIDRPSVPWRASQPPRLTPELVQRVLDTDNAALNSNGARLAEFIESNFTQVDVNGDIRPMDAGRITDTLDAMTGRLRHVIASTAIGGSDYHGLGRESTNPEAVTASAHEALTRFVERHLGDEVTVGTDRQGRTVLRVREPGLLRRVHKIRIEIDSGPLDRLPHVSEARQLANGSWRIRLPEGMTDANVARAVSGQLARILAFGDRPDAMPGGSEESARALGRGPHPADRLNPRDEADLAEAALLADRISDPDTSEASRAQAERQLDRLLDDLGLRNASGSTAARRSMALDYLTNGDGHLSAGTRDALTRVLQNDPPGANPTTRSTRTPADQPTIQPNRLPNSQLPRPLDGRPPNEQGDDRVRPPDPATDASERTRQEHTTTDSSTPRDPDTTAVPPAEPAPALDERLRTHFDVNSVSIPAGRAFFEPHEPSVAPPSPPAALSRAISIYAGVADFYWRADAVRPEDSPHSLEQSLASRREHERMAVAAEAARDTYNIEWWQAESAAHHTRLAEVHAQAAAMFERQASAHRDQAKFLARTSPENTVRHETELAASRRAAEAARQNADAARVERRLAAGAARAAEDTHIRLAELHSTLSNGMTASGHTLGPMPDRLSGPVPHDASSPNRTQDPAESTMTSVIGLQAAREQLASHQFMADHSRDEAARQGNRDLHETAIRTMNRSTQAIAEHATAVARLTEHYREQLKLALDHYERIVGHYSQQASGNRLAAAQWPDGRPERTLAEQWAAYHEWLANTANEIRAAYHTAWQQLDYGIDASLTAHDHAIALHHQFQEIPGRSDSSTSPDRTIQASPDAGSTSDSHRSEATEKPTVVAAAREMFADIANRHFGENVTAQTSHTGTLLVVRESGPLDRILELRIDIDAGRLDDPDAVAEANQMNEIAWQIRLSNRIDPARIEAALIEKTAEILARLDFEHAEAPNAAHTEQYRHHEQEPTDHRVSDPASEPDQATTEDHIQAQNQIEHPASGQHLTPAYARGSEARARAHEEEAAALQRRAAAFETAIARARTTPGRDPDAIEQAQARAGRDNMHAEWHLRQAAEIRSAMAADHSMGTVEHNDGLDPHQDTGTPHSERGWQIGDPIPPPRHGGELPTDAHVLECYRGEEDPNNPGRLYHPDTVLYMTPGEREACRLFVDGAGNLRRARDGIIFDCRWSPKTGNTMFVMDSSGNLYAAFRQREVRIQHSSILAGESVVGAGHLEVHVGRLVEMSNDSGHYRPTTRMRDLVLQALRDQGLRTDSDLSLTGSDW